MNRDIVELRQVIEKLVPMLTGRGLKVTQSGSRAYVETNMRTNKPERVNIPAIPDDAEQDFILAVSGFIDHEVGHVLFTDWAYYGGTGTVAEKSSAKGRMLAQTHNCVEDPYVERRICEKFPGSISNLAQLHEHFLRKVTTPALIEVSGDPKGEFSVLMVPFIRALSGQQIFIDFMNEGNHWQQPLIADLHQKLSQKSLDLLKKARTTAETLLIAQEIYEILFERPQQQPPQPQPEPEQQPEQDQSNNDAQDNSDKTESQDKPEKKADEGDGDGERDHSDQDEDGEEGKPEDEGESASESGEEADEDGDASEESSEEAGDPDEEADGENAEDEGGDSEVQAGTEDESDASDGDAGGDEAEAGDEAGSGEQSGNGSTDDEDEGDGAGDGASQVDESAGDEESDDSGEQSASSGEDSSDGEGGGDEGEVSGGQEVATEGANDDGGSKTEDDEGGDTEDDGDADQSKGYGGDPGASMFEAGADDFKPVDLSSAISEQLSSMALRAINSSPYNVFTRDDDEIEIFDPDKLGLNVDDRWVPEMEDEVRGMVGKMQKDLERMMAAQSLAISTPGHKRGRLHAPSLYRVLQNDPRVFKQREEIKSKDTAATLLIDNSGSMRGYEIRVAMMAGYALAQTLERVNVPNEVLGFTTGHLSKESRRALSADPAASRFNRQHAIVMPIFKAFHERVTPTVKRRIAAQINHQHGMNTNIDGESLEYAAIRMMARPEKRKVMFVMSDGQPVGRGTDDHLRLTVENLDKMGIETVGIGINTNAVRQYYPRSIVLNSVEDLPGIVMNELRRVLQS